MRFEFKLRLICVAKERPIKQLLAATLNCKYCAYDVENLEQQKTSILVHANGDYPLL